MQGFKDPSPGGWALGTGRAQANTAQTPKAKKPQGAKQTFDLLSVDECLRRLVCKSTQTSHRPWLFPDSDPSPAGLPHGPEDMDAVRQAALRQRWDSGKALSKHHGQVESMAAFNGPMSLAPIQL
jgi:hypothetical protein